MAQWDDISSPAPQPKAAGGASPWDQFSSPVQRSWGDVAGEAVTNLPASAANTAKTVAQPLLHPIDTFNNMLDTASGGIRAGLKAVLPEKAWQAVDSADRLGGTANEAVDRTDQAAGAVGQFYKDRYGGIENIKNTLATDPVGAAFDASAVLTGGGAALERAPGVAGRVGQTVSAAGRAIDPVANTLRASSTVATGVGRTVGAARQMLDGRGVNGAYGRIVDALAENPTGGSPVDILADQYSVGPTGNNQAIARNTLDILGEEMARANGDRAAATQASVARIMAENPGMSQAAAQQRLRTLAGVNRDSPLFFGEAQTVSGSDATMRTGSNQGRIAANNANLDELGRVQESTVADQLDYLTNNGTTRSATETRNAIKNRQELLSQSMDNAIDTLPATGQGANAYGGTPQIPTGPRSSRAADIVDTADMVNQATQAGNAEYRAAYAAPTNNYVLVNWLPRLLGRYDQMAAARSGEYAEAMRRATDQFVLRLPNGGRTTMQTLQQLQDARGAVRGMMDGYAAQNRNDLARVIRPIYDQVTRMMEYANPTWGRANRMWADMNFLRMGQELGDSFAQRAGPRFREQLDEFRNLAPQAQDIVRVHFLQQIKDKLANAGDTHALSKFFANDHNRAAIRQMFGDEAAISFTRAVRDQKAAEQTQAMLHNSKTHRRGQTQKQMDADTGLITAVENASVTSARHAILEWFKQRITESRNRPLAGILTTPLQDTAGVAQHIHNLRQAEQRAQRFQNMGRPRDLNTPAARAGAAAGTVLGRNNEAIEKKERRGFAGQRI